MESICDLWLAETNENTGGKHEWPNGIRTCSLMLLTTLHETLEHVARRYKKVENAGKNLKRILAESKERYWKDILERERQYKGANILLAISRKVNTGQAR